MLKLHYNGTQIHFAFGIIKVEAKLIKDLTRTTPESSYIELRNLLDLAGVTYAIAEREFNTAKTNRLLYYDGCNMEISHAETAIHLLPSQELTDVLKAAGCFNVDTY